MNQALTEPQTVGSPLLWGGFILFVLAMLALDLGVFHRKAHVVRFKEALMWSGVWVSLALVFNLGIWWRFGADPAVQFLTGYLIEKALSVDNVFIFAMIFAAFAVPSAYQHKVLFWGVVGALGFRLVFIFGGAALLQALSWTAFLLGALLLWTGWKMAFQHDTDADPNHNLVVRLVRRFVPTTPEFHGSRFFVRIDGRRTAPCCS